MTTVIANVNLNLVSNASVADYRDRTVASAVALLSVYAVNYASILDQFHISSLNYLLSN